MDTSQFFPDNEPKLSPEDQVRENQRLKQIDKDTHDKARRMLAEKQDSSEEARQLAEKLKVELPDLAKNAAERLVNELDPDFTYAQNIPITKLVSKPSRFLFLQRQVKVLEKRDVAVWHIHITLDAVSMPFIGRDGVLYAMYGQQEGFAIKEMDLSLFSLADLEELSKGIPGLIQSFETIRKFSE